MASNSSKRHSNCGCEFVISGFESDNLLAFLALVGLLRVIEHARETWNVRASWEGVPLHPVIHLAQNITEDEFIAAVVDGINMLNSEFDFCGKENVDYSPEEFRILLCDKKNQIASGTLNMFSMTILSAIGTDGSMTKDKKKIIPTPLCLMYGSGHQSFLLHLSKVAESRKNAVDDIKNCLFKTWSYNDEGKGKTFRWDYMEDRRHAYRYSDPSGSSIKTVSGANLLAIFGFPSFSVMPVSHKSISMPGFYKNFLTWPIWNVPVSKTAIEIMLTHPELVKKNPDINSLKTYGIIQLFRTEKISVGRFSNFKRAVSL